MNIDTFSTIAYKSGWIHVHYDRDLKREVVRVQFSDYTSMPVNSVQAGKIAITSFENRHGTSLA